MIGVNERQIQTGSLDTTGDALARAVEELGVHDHLCLIYETREDQFAAVIPFMKIGLERGERCVYIADDNTAEVVIEAMKAAGLDVQGTVGSGQLAILSKRDTYLKEGHFDPDGMIGFLRSATDEAKAAGFSALRATGEMTWMLGGDPGTERLMEYESKLNNFIPRYDVLAICQYNRNRFSPEVIRDVISTHPLVIYGGMICKNFYYVPPGDFLGERRPAKEIDRLLHNIQSRERVEESLRESEEKYRQLLTSAGVGVGYWSLEGRLLLVNPAAAEVMGGHPEDFAGKTAWELFGDDTGALIEARNKHAAETESGQVYEDFVRLATGPRWFQSHYNRVVNGRGQVVGIQIISSDITGRKMIDEALRKSELKYRSLYQQMLDAFVRVSMDGHILECNHAYCGLTGYTRAELADLAYVDLTPSKWHDMERRIVEDQVLPKGDSGLYEKEYRRKDGTLVPVELRSYLDRDQDGHPTAIWAIIRDITEKKRAEEALRKSEAMYRSVVTAMAEGVVFQSADGVVTAVNPAAERIEGCTSEEMLGRTSDDPLWGAIHEDGTPFPAESHPSMVTLRTGEPQSNVVMGNHRPDGTLVWISINSQPLVAPGQSTPYAVVTTFHDITERRKVEEALKTSEEKFLKAFRSSPIALTLAGVDDGVLVEANHAFEQITGYSLSESLGKTASELNLFPDPRERGRLFELLKNMRQVRNAEMHLQHKSGEFRTVLCSSEPITIGKSEYVLSTTQDITERKRAEEAQRESEQRYRSLFEHSPVPHWEEDFSAVKTRLDELRARGVADLRAHFRTFPGELRHCASLIRIVDVNQASLGFFSVSDKDALSRRLTDFFVADSWPVLSEELARLHAGDTSFRSEIPVQTLGGEPRVVDLTLSVTPGFEATWSRVLVSWLDVTERKRAEESLRMMGLELQTISDNTHTLFAYLDRDFNFIRVNRAYAEGDEKHPDYFIGKNHFDLYPNAENEAIFRRVVDTGQPCVYEAKPFVYPDHPEWGTTYWDWTLVPVMSAGKSATGLIFALLNVTERKRAEIIRQAIYSITRAANASKSLGEFLEAVHVIIRGIMAARNFYIALCDKQDGLIHFPYFADEKDPPPPPMPMGSGLTAHVLRTRKPLLADAARIETLKRDGVVVPAGSPAAVWLGVPLLREERAIGVLAVQDYSDPKAFGEPDQQVLEFVASEVAHAIELKRSEEEVQRLNRLYAVLSRTNEMIIRVQGPQALFDEACRIAVEHGSFKMAWVGVVDEKTHDVKPIAFYGDTGCFLESIRISIDDIPEGHGPAGTALRKGRHFVCRDIEHEPFMAPWREAAGAMGYRSSAAFPLRTGDAVMGVYAVYSSEVGWFSEGEIRLLDELTADMSYALGSMQKEDLREQAEKQLHLLGTAIEQASEVIVITDREGTILYANPAFEEISGYSRWEAIGKNPRIFKSGCHDAAFYKNLWDTILAGSVWSGRLINKRKDGRLYTEQSVISPVRDPAGAIIAFVAGKRDITKELELQQELNAAKDLETIGMIAGGVAHEVRNPLFAISTVVAALVKKLAGQTEFQEYADHIQDQTRRLNELMSDLLTLGRPLKSEQFQSCRLQDIVRDAIRLMADTVPDADRRCVVSTGGGTSAIRAVPEKLTQVIVNLLQNAFAFSPPDATVSVRFEQEAGQVRLHIQDSGSGIPADLLPAIFEPFQSKRKGGTGLGLAIVRQIVTAHGGTVEAANNDPPPGATFTVRLPLAGC